MAVGIARSCAKNRFRFSLLLCLAFIGGLILAILSLMQMTGQGKTSNGKKWSERCNEEETLQFVTPFRAQLQDGSYISCPWPMMDTIFRTTLSFSVPVLVVTLLVTLRKLYWTASWILCRYAMLVCSGSAFAVFVLDCEHLRTGFTLCNKNFKIDGTQIIQTNSKIEKCWLTPHIWTIFVDIILFFLLTWTYLTMQFYPYFGVTSDYKSKKDLERVPDHEPHDDKTQAQKTRSKSSFNGAPIKSSEDEEEEDKNVDKTLLTAQGGQQSDETEPEHWKFSNAQPGAYDH
ncbi:hypothetical protein RFI_12456 [Reticulomyxa filosa]|uniref:Transmembrane protein n=1 Tax=Reticulomyxa filosa TaxID=46433 RepID=X6NG01_RETFI|nr:hypothetical protein RFI_12456 [Reticulomyxa filosa]|eukprot:ETO24699.1 hypothetical protein RFI_12456 [Reticulomyxa filosa]